MLGPFVFESWTPNEAVNLSANRDCIGKAHAAGSMGMRPAVADFAAVTRQSYPARRAAADRLLSQRQVHAHDVRELLASHLDGDLRPGCPALDLCLGRPCSSPFHRIPVVDPAA